MTSPPPTESSGIREAGVHASFDELLHLSEVADGKEEAEEKKATIGDVVALLDDGDLLQCFDSVSESSLAVLQPGGAYVRSVEEEIQQRYAADPPKRQHLLQQLHRLQLGRRPFLDSLVVAARNEVDRRHREKWAVARELARKGRNEVVAHTSVGREEMQKMLNDKRTATEDHLGSVIEQMRGGLQETITEGVADRVKEWWLDRLEVLAQTIAGSILAAVMERHFLPPALLPYLSLPLPSRPDLHRPSPTPPPMLLSPLPQPHPPHSLNRHCHRSLLHQWAGRRIRLHCCWGSPPSCFLSLPHNFPTYLRLRLLQKTPSLPSALLP